MFRLMALGFGTALALLAGELAYRVVRLPRLSPTHHPRLVMQDEVLGWSLRPGARLRHATEEFDVEVAINAQGFRGPDWPEPGSERSARHTVLVLGDSFAFGWGVDWELSLAGRLAAARPGWNVLNAAVPGYGTDQELIVLRRVLRERRIDVVVCVFCRNDLWEVGTDVAYGKRKPWFPMQAGVLEAEPTTVPASWLEANSMLYGALCKKVWEWEFARRAVEPEREWERVQTLYRAMRDALGAVPLVIVSAEETLARFAAAEPNVEHVDVSAALSASTEPVVFAVDGHWNARGHGLVADAVLDPVRGVGEARDRR